MRKLLLGAIASLLLATPSVAASMESTLAALEQPRYTQNLGHSNQRQVLCLALNIYHEARGSTHQDKVGVAWVTRNRVESRHSRGRNYCQIIWERGQYSWTVRSTQSLMPREMGAWHTSTQIARQVIDGTVRDPTNGANTFYATRLGTPRWTRSGTGRTVIGAHTYVRLPGR